MINPGTTVYNRNGAEAQYVTFAEGMHIVRPVLEMVDGYGDSYDELGEVTTWHEVFTSPPAEKLHTEIAKLNEQIAAKQSELDALRAVRDEEDKETKARQARLARHEQLALLDAYLDGKITHYVTERSYGSVEIIPIEKAVSDENSYHKQPRLLALHGNTDERRYPLSWKLSRYSDGSGSSQTVFPCCSYEEALKKAAEQIEAAFNEWRKDNIHYISETVNSAIKLGLPVPKDAQDHVQQQKLQTAQAAVVNAEKQLAAERAILDKLIKS